MNKGLVLLLILIFITTVPILSALGDFEIFSRCTKEWVPVKMLDWSVSARKFEFPTLWSFSL